jgi:hypothetical protein
MASLRRDLDVELLLGKPATSLHTAEQVVIAAGKQIRDSGLVIATARQLATSWAAGGWRACTRCAPSRRRSRSGRHCSPAAAW